MIGRVPPIESLDVLVSYRKALQVLTAELAPWVEPERVEAALTKALPEKQRERLEARS